MRAVASMGDTFDMWKGNSMRIGWVYDVYRGDTIKLHMIAMVERWWLAVLSGLSYLKIEDAGRLCLFDRRILEGLLVEGVELYAINDISIAIRRYAHVRRYSQRPKVVIGTGGSLE